jgi:hypothetical protein
MTRSFHLLAIAASPLLAAPQTDLDQALLFPAHSCTFCNKDQAGPIMLSASFLIWQSKEWGLEFASKSLIESDPAFPSQTFQQKLSVPDFSWSPGFKIDLGGRLPYDGWNLNSRWTFYHGDFTNLKKHFDSQIAPIGLGIVPLWHYPFFEIAPSSAPLRFQSGSANWKLFFNSFDLDLGRGFSPTRSLILRMHMGAKGSWIRQHYHVEYSNGTIVEGILSPFTPASLQYLNSRMVFNSRAWGLGPRGGLESKWKLGWGFSLVADSGFTLLASFFDMHTHYFDQIAQPPGNLDNTMKMKEHSWDLTPVFEGSIGLDWGYCFGRKENPYFLGMTFAYELQYWWSQNQVRRSYAYQAPGNMWDMRGDLQMHGLTASIRSDF